MRYLFLLRSFLRFAEKGARIAGELVPVFNDNKEILKKIVPKKKERQQVPMKKAPSINDEGPKFFI